jgi:hypothetical protein
MVSAFFGIAHINVNKRKSVPQVTGTAVCYQITITAAQQCRENFNKAGHILAHPRLSDNGYMQEIQCMQDPCASCCKLNGHPTDLCQLVPPRGVHHLCV